MMKRGALSRDIEANAFILHCSGGKEPEVSKHQTIRANGVRKEIQRAYAATSLLHFESPIRTIQRRFF